MRTVTLQEAETELSQLIDAALKGEEIIITQAVTDIEQAIIALYGEREVSIQQLAATFRRGDLISLLEG